MLKLSRITGSLILLGLSMTLKSTVDASQPRSLDSLVYLTQSVVLTDEEQAFVRSLPVLKVSAYEQTPPLSLYNRSTNQYQGISIDIFSFIANEIGLSYQFVNGSGLSFAELLQEFEQTDVDVLMPVSYIPERASLGIFTATYYEGFYSVIARKEDRFRLQSIDELAQYQVGVINKGSSVPYLQTLVPAGQLHLYDDGVIHEALRRKSIDLAIYHKSTFQQDRFRFELFDFENIYTIYENPRAYTFLFKHSDEHLKLVDIFNRYINVLDSSESVLEHENDEQRLIDKYVKQQSQQHILLIVIVAASILLFVLLMAYRSRRRMLAELSETHAYIVRQHASLHKANAKLEQISRIDALTELANRRYFNEQFSLEYAQHIRSGAPLSLMMVDIDFFKNINDQYGHAIGDAYLNQIAVTLSAALSRPTDFVARYGGEEFVCLLPDTDLPGALVVAEHARQAVMMLNLDSVVNDSEPISVSIGVATLQGAQYSADELLTHADIQLYNAKSSGRNCVRGILLSHRSSDTDVEAAES